MIVLFFAVTASCKSKEPLLSDLNVPVIQSFDPKNGAEGTIVTITGSNFNSTPKLNQISLGGKTIEPTSASTTQLIFTVPSGIANGSYMIGVKVGSSTSGSKEQFVVNANTNPGNFVSHDVVPVTSEVVNTCFYGFGKKDIHPRLLFTAADIARIKNIAASDPVAKASYDDVINQANQILSTSLLDYALDGAGLRIANIHTFANDQVPYLVLAYQFTKDTRYAQRCWQQIEAMASWPDWGANRHFLDTGIGAKGVALAYDGLYDFLTPDQRLKIVNALRKYTLEPGKTQIENGTGSWKWYLSNNNWNGICHGGLIMAALAIYETDPSFMSKVIQISSNGIVPFMQSFDPDGASAEGLMYWSYGLSNTFLAYESMKNVLSSTYGLAEMNGFKKTPSFPYQVSGPAGTATMGDDYLYYGSANRFLSYFWYARYFKDADFAKTHYEICLSRNSGKTNKLNGWMDLLFYDPELVARGSQSSFPLYNYIAGADYMFVRENNTDPSSLYIGMHGGDNNASHGHLDAGTFFIQALGENFAVGNLGKEDPYPADYFTTTGPNYDNATTNNATNPGRFYYYRVRTEGKNCLVFNPDARPEQNLTGKAVLKKESNDNSGGYYVLNMTACYKRDVSNYTRGIKLNRNSGIITIQDEFIPIVNSTVYWIMHSAATDGLVISTDGKKATMTKNGKVFYATIKSPSNARFEKVDRSETAINFLPETAPIFSTVMAGKNSINKWYGKLQIKLTDVKKDALTTIRVDLTSNNSIVSPDLVLMDNWTTNN
ncbi:MAG: IPT/TIG domain-containing protein [Prolixibacteraceae bacterium]|nr:IPT/TIG domain-containing protein [Prolixibacteraceae bacterium]